MANRRVVAPAQAADEKNPNPNLTEIPATEPEEITIDGEAEEGGDDQEGSHGQEQASALEATPQHVSGGETPEGDAPKAEKRPDGRKGRSMGTVRIAVKNGETLVLQPGEYASLAEAEAAITAATETGVYVIIRMHRELELAEEVVPQRVVTTTRF
jgi:hypothetical protein